MQPLSQQHARQAAYRILGLQIIVTGAAGALFFLFGGSPAGLSAAVGGAISVIGSYIQVRIAFARILDNNPRRTAVAFYLAEGVKIVVIMALFVFALSRASLPPLPMIVAFGATLFVFLAALIMPSPGERQG